VKKIAQNVTIFGQYSRITLTVEKSCPTMWADSLILKKTAQSKQSPNGRKFLQSGHPVCNVEHKTEWLEALIRSLCWKKILLERVTHTMAQMNTFFLQLMTFCM
jgi:hypothetical protein